MQCDVRGAAQAVPECSADHAIGDDVAKRIDALRVRVEAGKAEPPGLRYVDGTDCRRLPPQAIPYAETLKDAPAGVTERGRALIEARLRG
jgi:hypothetical protein